MYLKYIFYFRSEGLMLSQQTIQTIKATVPVLEQHGVEITTQFYKRLFEHHPELLNIFNHANQKKGRQQTALANTLYAAAQHIEQLEVLVPAVTQIAHKHRSLGVKKEHYPIVGEHLLAAMKEVLGEAATDEVIQAWGDAYGVIANIFIDVEESMYDEADWREFKPFIVSNKVKESAVITSFYLVAKDGQPAPSSKPGQYVTVKVKPEGEQYTSNRQYSLSSNQNEEYLRISVKKELNGKVSNYLHDDVKVGDEIEVSAPAGDFTLKQDSDSPAILISGGVGITPMMGMLHSIASANSSRKTAFIHACKNEQVQAFKQEASDLITAINGEIYTKYEDQSGRLSAEDLANFVNEDGEYYVCGPALFMKSVIAILSELGVPNEKIHFEFFGPAISFEQAENKVGI